jgi:hypothetical protein
MKYAGRLTVPVILVMSIVTASLWQGLLRRSVSESGRLCSGDENHGARVRTLRAELRRRR